MTLVINTPKSALFTTICRYRIGKITLHSGEVPLLLYIYTTAIWRLSLSLKNKCFMTRVSDEKGRRTMPEQRTIRRRWAHSSNRRVRGFTPRVRRLLYAAIEAGLPYNRSCEITGVNYQNFKYWMQRGKSDPVSSPYTQFRRYIKRIEARKEAELLAVIDKVAEGEYKVKEREIQFHPDKGRSIKIKTRTILPNWKAAAWRLERKFPDEYYLKDNESKERTPEEIAESIHAAFTSLENSVPEEEAA